MATALMVYVPHIDESNRREDPVSSSQRFSELEISNMRNRSSAA